MSVEEYLHVHRMGLCGEGWCILQFTEEMSLELPHDPAKREAWYRAQASEYNEWRRNLFLHRWSFRIGRCNHCEGRGIVLRAAWKALCVEWCLNTNLDRYPSGHQQPNLSDVIAHSRKCTSHWSSLTSKHIERLETMFGSSDHTSGLERYGHMSLLPKGVTRKNCFSHMPSRNSDSLSPLWLDSNTPKK